MGWTYNTADDVQNEGPKITAVAVVLTGASLSISLLRFYVRVCMIKSFGAGMSFNRLFYRFVADNILTDDWALLFTWVGRRVCI